MDIKWAVITGSSRGLGLEIALALASTGFGTVITGRNPKTLKSAVNRLKTTPTPACHAICIDFIKQGSPNNFFANLKAKDIKPSVIVNNLGGAVQGDRRNIPIGVLRAAFRLNLEVGIEINNLFYEDLKSQNGMIVHIGSTASLHFDAPPGYVMSKAALNAYVKNAARLFAKDGVCIFAVLAGIIDHEGSYIDNLRHSNPERYNTALMDSTYGRFMTSEELARFIVRIIESRTPMVNGSLIQIDGGKN